MELAYLVYLVGWGQLKPQATKVEVILKAAWPHTKKQLRQFLGLVGYYSRFIPEYTTWASLLIDHQGKLHPNSLMWDTIALTISSIRPWSHSQYWPSPI